MKKVILTAMVFLGIATTKGYSQDTMRTLFHVHKINSCGFYVAPEFQYGQLKTQFTTFGGMSGMMIFNRTFGIGITGAMSMDRGFSPTGVSPLYLHSRFGGLKLEYTINPNSPVHITIPLVIGGGFAQMDSGRLAAPRLRDSLGRREPLSLNRNDMRNFFIIQPGVQIETNLFRTVKLYAGANYRFAFAGAGGMNIPTNTMQGFSANVGLKIGLFDIATSKKHLQ